MSLKHPFKHAYNLFAKKTIHEKKKKKLLNASIKDVF